MFLAPGAAQVAGSRLLVSTPPTSYDPADGRELWKASIGGLSLGGLDLDETGDVLYCGFVDNATSQGVVAAIEASTGKTVWTAPLGEDVLPLLERPWRVGATVVVPLWSGEIAGLDAASGAIRWRHRPAVARLGGVTVAGRRVWFLTRHGEVVGLDLNDGRPAARFASPVPLNAAEGFAQRPSVVGRRLIVPLNTNLVGFEIAP
jgi:outer membrane protein assembly factor BamB